MQVGDIFVAETSDSASEDTGSKMSMSIDSYDELINERGESSNTELYVPESDESSEIYFFANTHNGHDLYVSASSCSSTSDVYNGSEYSEERMILMGTNADDIYVAESTQLSSGNTENDGTDQEFISNSHAVAETCSVDENMPLDDRGEDESIAAGDQRNSQRLFLDDPRDGFEHNSHNQRDNENENLHGQRDNGNSTIDALEYPNINKNQQANDNIVTISHSTSISNNDAQCSNRIDTSPPNEMNDDFYHRLLFKSMSLDDDSTRKYHRNVSIEARLTN